MEGILKVSQWVARCVIDQGLFYRQENWGRFLHLFRPSVRDQMTRGSVDVLEFTLGAVLSDRSPGLSMNHGQNRTGIASPSWQKPIGKET